MGRGAADGMEGRLPGALHPELMQAAPGKASVPRYLTLVEYGKGGR